MSTRNKLYKFAQNLTFPNVVQNFNSGKEELIGQGHSPVTRKGNWRRAQYGNDHPITCELACGRGEYTLELARRYPERNFLGVDVKGARIYQGAKKALEENLTNVAFLRTRIEFIDLFFEEGELDEIWITFPDPFLHGNENNRLTSEHFLLRYLHILRQDGQMHLKTDEPILYAYTLEQIAKIPQLHVLAHSADLYAQADVHPDWKIATHYEKLHIADGDQICRVSWGRSEMES